MSDSVPQSELWTRHTGRDTWPGVGIVPRLGSSLLGTGSSAGKESTLNAGGSIPGSGRSPGEGIGYPLQYSWAFLVAQTIKNLPAMRKPWVRSLGWEALLEKGMATRSSSFAWGIPWTEEPGGLQSTGS